MTKLYVCVCVCVYIYIYIYTYTYRVWVSLFNGISTFVDYLMPKPYFEKNSSDAI